MPENKALTAKEQSRVRDWGGSWFDLERKDCTLAQWLRIKLGVSQAKAVRYAEWLESLRPLRSEDTDAGE